MSTFYHLLLIFPVFCGYALASPRMVYNWQGVTGNYTGFSQQFDVFYGQNTGFFYSTAFYFSNTPEGYIPDPPTGYIGVQPRDNGYNSIRFSFFGYNATTFAPHCGNGADAYDGITCAYDWPWQFNRNYTFDVSLTANHSNGTRTWTGRIIDTDLGNSTELGWWTLPQSLGFIKGYNMLGFDEVYTRDGDDNFYADADTRACLPHTEYVQYSPVLRNDNNETLELSLTDIYLPGKEDICALAANDNNRKGTPLPGNAGILVENGFLPSPSSSLVSSTAAPTTPTTLKTSTTTPPPPTTNPPATATTHHWGLPGFTLPSFPTLPALPTFPAAPTFKWPF